MKKTIKEYLWITAATALLSVGIYFFKFPNNFSTGGVSGLAVILTEFFPILTAANYSTILNFSLLIFGFVFLGKDFGAKTLYSTIVQTVFVQGLEFIYPISEPITDQPMLELVFAIMIMAIGGAIIFDYGGSTGGTDIIAMVIKKRSSINISKALFCVDVVIVMMNFFVFGIENWMFSVLAFVAKIFMLNSVIKSFHLSKFCTIINAQFEKDVCEYITNELKRSATVSESYKGAYGHEDKCVLLAALSSSETQKLKAYIKSIDSQGFVIATDTSEISGRGFRDMI